MGTPWTLEQQTLHARAWKVSLEAVALGVGMQLHDELCGALGHVAQTVNEPAVIVEIGCGYGGTLYAWRTMFPDAAVYGVTLDGDMLRSDYGATVLVGNSHDRATRQRLLDQLGGRRPDVLFIDGDHEGNGPVLDWEMYAPLVRPGGLTLFHDVANEREPGSVAAWEQLKAECVKAGKPYVEILSKAHRKAGFGIVQMAGEGNGDEGDQGRRLPGQRRGPGTPGRGGRGRQGSARSGSGRGDRGSHDG